MNRSAQTLLLAFALTSGAGLTASIPCRADTAPATAPAARSESDIMQELQATSMQLRSAVPSLAAVANPEARKQVGPTAIPLLKKLSGLFVELSAAQTDAAEKTQTLMQRYQIDAFRIAFGDAEARTALEAEAKTANGAAAIPSQSALATADWWLASNDAAAQTKILDAYSAVAKAHPADPAVAGTLGAMMQLGAANDTVKKQVVEIVRKNLTGDEAKSMLAQADAEQALKDMEGKPFVAAGRTTTGGKFSSADWKGKVILIDCWATWCGPCKAELPRTKKLYEDYHAAGLELVGVDCDGADEVVNDFTKENNMPWPQVRETSQTDQDNWSPLAKQWHVMGIPTMMLVDRKGVLRHVDGREDTETKVKALLAEKAEDPQ